MSAVFELSPSGGGWVATTLHVFSDGDDGGRPISSLVLDADGNLYGTTSDGGMHGSGAIFEIAP